MIESRRASERTGYSEVAPRVVVNIEGVSVKREEKPTQIGRTAPDNLDEAVSRHELAERELRALAHRLMDAQENERFFLASALNDHIWQYIAGLKLSLDSLGRLPPESETKLQEARRTVDELLATLRSLAPELRPPMLDDLGLLPALIWHLENYTVRTGVLVDFRHHQLDLPIPLPVRMAAYRIIEESLVNVARHSGVDLASVETYPDHGHILLEVEDRGLGFETGVAMHPNCCGITGMRERAAAVGGWLTVQSAPGRGTRVIAELPLAPSRSLTDKE